MKSVNILLPDVAAVKLFVNIIEQCDFDADLVSGRYRINAKSMMGISAWVPRAPLPWNCTPRMKKPPISLSKKSALFLQNKLQNKTTKRSEGIPSGRFLSVIFCLRRGRS